MKTSEGKLKLKYEFEVLTKHLFTFSARMARLSLSVKNPETGPVWWYLKPIAHRCINILYYIRV